MELYNKQMNKSYLCVTFNIPFLYSMLFCVEALSLPLIQPIHNMKDYIQKLSAYAKNNSPALILKSIMHNTATPLLI